MGQVRRGRCVRLAAVGMLAALAWGMCVAPAAAAEDSQSVSALQKAPVVAITCDPCHANISDTKLPGVKFKHAAHIMYDCKACHTIFPHQPEGTSIPRMPQCWTCHALRHGPQGQMAESDCGKCHKSTKGMRPKSHIKSWVGKPHVKPGEDQLSTLCMMCHDQKSCEDCHVAEKIVWIPKAGLGAYAFDVGNGCLACHGSELPRLGAPVTGIDASAHRDLTCPKCHPDFKYDDGKDATKLWQVNSSGACLACHADRAEKGEETKSVLAFAGSVHGKALAKGNLKSATCAGCHGGHDVERLETNAAKRRLHLAGQDMCSGCHAREYASYDDYWHGKAYKRGAIDAPACWDCHGGHDVMAVKDPKGPVSPEQLAKTCGKCHEGSREDFAVAAGSLIHGVPEVAEDNPLRKLLGSVIPGED